MLDERTPETVRLSSRALDREDVLEVMTMLLEQTISPVIRECLRCARSEIAYLTSTEGSGLEVEHDLPEVEEIVHWNE